MSNVPSTKQTLPRQESQTDISLPVRSITVQKPPRPERILIVDDDFWVVDVISRQLALEGFQVDTTIESDQVMAMLADKAYDLVISDLSMPPPDGLTLLKQIQKQYPFTAVLMLTGVNDVKTAIQSMLDGASDYLVKPHNEAQLLLRAERALERSRLLRERASYYQRLEEQVEQQTHKLREQSHKLTQMLNQLYVTYRATLNALEAALDVRDQSSPGHCRRVSKLAVRLAKKLGLKGQDLTNIEHGALLHDIGKLSIPDAILLKPGPLTPEERRTVENHPNTGVQIVGHIDFLAGALPVVRYHHERYDGTGYPDGLKGKEIPLLARIFSIVDAFDAQISQRPYNRVRTVEGALAELQAGKGTSFDPEIVDIFSEMILEEDLDKEKTSASKSTEV